jgi:transcriptional regulator with XRE-family HTH domain
MVSILSPSSHAAQSCVINAYVSYRIRRARQFRKLSTGDVAVALGIERETYERLEDAQSFITTSTMMQCAQVTDTPVNDFLPPVSLTQLASEYSDSIQTARTQKWETIFKAIEEADDTYHHLSVEQLRQLVKKIHDTKI